MASVAARGADTLLRLTLAALAALLLPAVLEAVRGRAMGRVAAWAEHRAGPDAFARAVEAQPRAGGGAGYGAEALRDLAACRGFLAGPGTPAVHDLPWVPVYLVVVFLLHPALGFVSLGAAAGRGGRGRRAGGLLWAAWPMPEQQPPPPSPSP